MNESRKILPILFLHFALGFAACAVWAFTRGLDVDLLSPFVFAYRFRSAVIAFIGLLPTLTISGFLMGYSISFRAVAGEAVGRWSDTLLTVLKHAYILMLACLALYAVFAEGISPALTSRQKQAVVLTKDFKEYMRAARRFVDDSQPALAVVPTRAALQVWPGNKEALYLLDQIGYKQAEGAGGSDAKGRVRTASEEAVIREASGLTVLEALDKAIEADKKNDYFNAHYYASLAARLAPTTDPNHDVAVRLAAQAWNRVSEGHDRIQSRAEADLYGIKRDGYKAIGNQDYLRAYYIFLELREAELATNDRLGDPDVERFLEISRKGVLESFFFIDETASIKIFESSRDVFFVIRHPDGSADAVFASGITYTSHSGTDMAYLRGFEFASFDRNLGLRYQISVPYAKMVASTSGAKGSARPEILLRSVDRNREGVDVVPAVIAGAVPESERNILMLSMDYRDFSLLVEANRGPDSMSVMDLWNFVPKAESYGFSRKTFNLELIRRLVDPFLLLILSVCALILGWQFRLGKSVMFKFWWIFTVPVFPVLSYLAVEGVRYVSRLCNGALIALLPSYPLIPVLLALVVCFLGVSLAFFSQRSE
ncbi:MAG TPA: hypothetical protein PKO22_10010 [Treponemataceae bacterium]|nr:hypothetical protein [Treponemataceae bacterium]